MLPNLRDGHVDRDDYLIQTQVIWFEQLQL